MWAAKAHATATEPHTAKGRTTKTHAAAAEMATAKAHAAAAKSSAEMPAARGRSITPQAERAQRKPRRQDSG
jgi:hypothetical protein